LSMRVLTRMWQMLLKALDEVASAPNAMMAAEMSVIRLTHVADLPSPDELIRRLQDSPPPPPPTPGGGMAHWTNGTTSSAQGSSIATTHNGGATTMRGGAGAAVAIATHGDALSYYATFDHVVELIRAQRDVKLLVEVETCVKLSSYQPGRIEFEPTQDAPADLAQRLGNRLQTWTGQRWAVSLVNSGGRNTISEVKDAAALALKQSALQHPLVQAVVSAFPKAKITDIKTPQDLVADAQAEALPEVEDEWDPFEEE
jgi:DNA polymerase-3 subunit gamma/tau